MKTAEKTVTVRLLDKDGNLTAPQVMQKVVKTDKEWEAQLTPEQYKIARAKGTEPAFCGAFYDNHKTGYYSCICCQLPLFRSGAKFDSGTGWPSFFEPIAKENIIEKKDLGIPVRLREDTLKPLLKVVGVIVVRNDDTDFRNSHFHS